MRLARRRLTPLRLAPERFDDQFELLFRSLLQIHELIARGAHRAYQLIQLQMNLQSVACLTVLNHENHQEGGD